MTMDEVVKLAETMPRVRRIHVEASLDYYNAILGMAVPGKANALLDVPVYIDPKAAPGTARAVDSATGETVETFTLGSGRQRKGGRS